MNPPKPYKPPPHRKPLDHERCRAIALTTGKRCWQYKDSADPNEYCNKHTATRVNAIAGKYQDAAANLVKFGEMIIE
jgi:glucose dehydrogenase